MTGTPGVGKSSVARLLASRLSAKLISLGDLVRNERLYIEVDEKRDTFVADLEKVSEALEKMIVGSTGDMVIEGHYAADTVNPENVFLAFVLRRDPRVLKDTLERRDYGEEKVRENLAAEILDVCLYDAVSRLGVSKVCEVDMTGRSVEDAVEEVLLILDGRKDCTVGLVDWLGRLEAEGELDEYLKEF